MNLAEMELIFHRALECPTPEARRAYLDAVLAAHPDARPQIESLLEAHQAPTRFLETRPVPTHDVSAIPSRRIEPEPRGARIGRYKLLQKIGEGGMGIVYMAEQEEPVRRRVALKVIKAGMDTPTVVARFEAERQALAMMDHPNIARVFDAGTTGQSQKEDGRGQKGETSSHPSGSSFNLLPSSFPPGRPYFVMELVQGIPITRYCREATLTNRERLSLFIDVCSAVQHAHQKGIIHRDLKPSNVLVTVLNDRPVPKVIDFGIAKATQERLTDKTLFTQFYHFIGTPAYMSPEQANLGSLDIDTRSDIYSLGVLLYEMLTETTPFDARELLQSGLDEMRRVIREVDPVRPSTRLRQSREARLGAASRPAEPKALDSEVDTDLDWIVLKCLEKDRTRRYDTAERLASDIQRHLNHEPVTACPPSALYRLRKFIRRKKGAVLGAASVVIALLAGTAVAAWQAVDATRSREVAESARAQAIREQAVARAERDRAQTEAARSEAARAEAEHHAYSAAMAVARSHWEAGSISHLEKLLEQTRSYPDKGFEWYFWQRMCHADLGTIRQHDDAVTALAISPDGTRIATGGTDQTVRILDQERGQPGPTLRGHAREILTVGFAPDGKRILTTGRDGTVRVWDAETGVEVRIDSGIAAAFTPDGQGILLATAEGSLVIRDMESGRDVIRHQDLDTALRHVAMSADGNWLTMDIEGRLTLWIPGPEVSGPFRPAWSYQLLVGTHVQNPFAFSPDGRQIVTGGRDRIVRILDAATGKVLRTLEGHQEQVGAVSYSRDGRRIASGSLDRTVKLWDAETGESLRTYKGHQARVTAVAFSAEGRRLFSSSDDGTVKIWETRRDFAPRLSGTESDRPPFVRYAPVYAYAEGFRSHTTNGINDLRFSPDGAHLLTASADRTIRLWDASSLHQIRQFTGHSASLNHADFSRDGTRIVSGDADGRLMIWDATTGHVLRSWAGPPFSMSAQFSADNRRLLTGAIDGHLRIWDPATGAEVRHWKAHDLSGVRCARYHPNQPYVLSVGAEGVIKVWDPDTGREVRQLVGHTDRVYAFAFNREGTRLASGGAGPNDTSIRIWNFSGGEQLMRLDGHVDQIWDLNFSSDSRRIVSAGYDGTVRIWSATTGHELLAVRGNSDFHMGARLSPDGRSLACIGEFPSIEVWDAATPDHVDRWRMEEEQGARRRQQWHESRSVRDAAQRSNLIRSWLVLASDPAGTAPYHLNATDSPAAAFEAALRPRPQDVLTIGSRRYRWKEARFDDGIIDFRPATGAESGLRLIGYAVAYIRSAETRRGLRLLIGRENPTSVYLNGERIYRRAFPGTTAAAPDTVLNVNLHAGINRLVFRTEEVSGRWIGFVEVLDASGQPVEGLDYITRPD